MNSVVEAFGLETLNGVKYVACAFENGGGMMRIKLPDGDIGKKIEQLLSISGTKINLKLEQNTDEDLKVVAIDAVN